MNNHRVLASFNPANELSRYEDRIQRAKELVEDENYPDDFIETETINRIMRAELNRFSVPAPAQSHPNATVYLRDAGAAFGNQDGTRFEQE